MLTGDVEHDHNAPGDGPLLRTNETASLCRWRHLRDVDWHLSGADTDAEAVDDTTDDEHGNVLCSRDDDAANDPNDRASPIAYVSMAVLRRSKVVLCSHDGLLPTEAIGEYTGEQRGEP